MASQRHYRHYIQQVVFTDSSFGIVLFGKKEIADIKRFCCIGFAYLGVGKAYILSPDAFVTATSFKQLSV